MSFILISDMGKQIIDLLNLELRSKNKNELYTTIHVLHSDGTTSFCTIPKTNLLHVFEYVVNNYKDVLRFEAVGTKSGTNLKKWTVNFSKNH